MRLATLHVWSVHVWLSQSWSLVVWRSIWFRVCLRIFSSCVCATPTTSMMTRKCDLYLPPPSTALRRSWRSRHTETHTHIIQELALWKLTMVYGFTTITREKHVFPLVINTPKHGYYTFTANNTVSFHKGFHFHHCEIKVLFLNTLLFVCRNEAMTLRRFPSGCPTHAASFTAWNSTVEMRWDFTFVHRLVWQWHLSLRLNQYCSVYYIYILLLFGDLWLLDCYLLLFFLRIWTSLYCNV